MPLMAANWPVTASLLPFSALKPDGMVVQDADAAEWVATFSEVGKAGFTHVDLTDSWVRPGDLSETRLDELKDAAAMGGWPWLRSRSSDEASLTLRR